MSHWNSGLGGWDLRDNALVRGWDSSQPFPFPGFRAHLSWHPEGRRSRDRRIRIFLGKKLGISPKNPSFNPFFNIKIPLLVGADPARWEYPRKRVQDSWKNSGKRDLGGAKNSLRNSRVSLRGRIFSLWIRKRIFPGSCPRNPLPVG